MRQRIVYTRPDGGVTINCPAPGIFRELQSGAWADKPNGWVDYQIDCAIKDGRDPDAVKRFCRAMVKGGVTDREVWALIRDRDCLHKGTLHELHDLADLPDRWFRNAWRRSHNGGPVGIDLELARLIQWERLVDATEIENRRRERSYNPKPAIKAGDAFRAAIKNARDTDELKRIWPENITQSM